MSSTLKPRLPSGHIIQYKGANENGLLRLSTTITTKGILIISAQRVDHIPVHDSELQVAWKVYLSSRSKSESEKTRSKKLVVDVTTKTKRYTFKQRISDRN